MVNARPAIGKVELGRRIRDWRSRGVSAETILTELEQFAVLLPNPGWQRNAQQLGNVARIERSRDRIEDVVDMLAWGESPYQIAARWDWTIKQMRRFLNEHGREDLARRFTTKVIENRAGDCTLTLGPSR